MKSNFSDQDILSLRSEGLSNKEISERLQVLPCTICRRLKKYGGNQNYLNQKRKSTTDELRAFLHRAEEIGFAELRKELGISRREINAIKSRCVKRGLVTRENYKSKDKRRKNKWSGDEISKMLMWSGIISREDIAKKLGSSSGRVIKERLVNMNIAGRDVNGVLLTKFREMFQCDPPRCVHSLTGPGGSAKYKIALWVDIEFWIKNKKIKSVPVITKKVEIMAMFQRWIWKGGRIKIWREIGKITQ